MPNIHNSLHFSHVRCPYICPSFSIIRPSQPSNMKLCRISCMLQRATSEAVYAVCAVGQRSRPKRCAPD